MFGCPCSAPPTPQLKSFLPPREDLYLLLGLRFVLLGRNIPARLGGCLHLAHSNDDPRANSSQLSHSGPGPPGSPPALNQSALYQV